MKHVTKHLLFFLQLQILLSFRILMNKGFQRVQVLLYATNVKHRLYYFLRFSSTKRIKRSFYTDIQ